MEQEEFEEGIAPPDRRKWDWLQRMKPGQSRWVNVSRRYAVSYALWYWSRRCGRKFASRKEGDGFRVFCLR